MPVPRIKLSVVVCSHNPRPDFLGRCLDAIKAQEHPREAWELILIDNASTQPLQKRFDLTWHINARHVREEELGIAPARIRAMREASSDLILFIDDDNVITPDYVRIGLTLEQEHQDLGCWGGQLLPEFEEEPPEWTRQWWPYLAIRPLSETIRATGPENYDAIPPTAGVFLRREVWMTYLELIKRDPRHLWLGLKGNQRVGGEDTDIALCAFDVGKTTARFPELVLTHIMPKSRLTVESLTSLIESISYSTVLIEEIRKNEIPAGSTLHHWFSMLRARRLPMPQRAFYCAELRGRYHARKKLRQGVIQTSSEKGFGG